MPKSSSQAAGAPILPNHLIDVLKASEACKISRVGALKALGLRKSKTALKKLSETINELESEGTVQKLGAHSVCLSRPELFRRSGQETRPRRSPFPRRSPRLHLRSRLFLALQRAESQQMSKIGALQVLGLPKTKASLDELTEAIEALHLEGAVAKLGGHSVCLVGHSNTQNSEALGQRVFEEYFSNNNKTKDKEKSSGTVSPQPLSAAEELFSMSQFSHKIIKFLSMDQTLWMRLSLVGPRWDDLCRRKEYLEQVAFRPRRGIENEDLPGIVASFSQLRKLDLSSCQKITDDGLHALHPLTDLKSLNLYNCSQITDKGLEALKPLTGLQHLNLGYLRITHGGLDYLNALQELQSLNLSLCLQITRLPFVTLKKLKSLDLSYCKEISEQGFLDLTFFAESLQSLNLTHCSRVHAQNMKALKSLVQLKSLNLSHCSIHDQDLQKLSPLVNLQNLNLSNCKGITQTDWKALSPLVNLQSLNLSQCSGVTDHGLQQLLKPLEQLKNLDLSHCRKITDEGLLLALEPLKQLKSLNLTSCLKITGQGLGELSSLQSLNLANCRRITGGNLEQALPFLRQLRSLTLSSTGIDRETRNGLQRSVLSRLKQNQKMAESSILDEEKDPERALRLSLYPEDENGNITGGDKKEVFVITEKQAKLSKLFEILFVKQSGSEENDVSESEVSLHTDNDKNIVKPKVLAKILEYLRYHNGEHPPKIQEPLPSSDLSEAVSFWDDEFIHRVSLERPELIFELILKAFYFGIDSLEELACAKVASMIQKSRTVEEMRTVLGIEADPDQLKDHETKVFEKYSWLVDKPMVTWEEGDGR